MANRTTSLLMASAAIIGISMVGCSSTSSRQQARLGAVPAPMKSAKVDAALAAKDYARALIGAEQLVLADPRNADNRALLGRALLANGRYISARQAFTDAMTLGNRDPRTIINLALCATGLEDVEAARALLVAHRDLLPAGDYGLAMAMAGDAREAVRALTQAVAMPDATARTRQNLAYALAMAGAWGQARLVAGQDLSADKAEARIGAWAQSIADGGERDRVVAMVGIAPRADDSGLAAEFALDTSAPSAPTQLAAADPAVPVNEVPPVAEAPPVADALAVADPAMSAGSDPVAPAPVAPATLASLAPVALPTLPAAFTAAAKAAPAKLTSLAYMVPADDAKASDWVVQVGAFESASVAQASWRRITASHAAIKAFKPVNSTLNLGGKAWHRVAIRGFSDHGTAQSACSSLRQTGQACFVRRDDTSATRVAREDARRKVVEQASAKRTGGVVASR